MRKKQGKWWPFKINFLALGLHKEKLGSIWNSISSSQIVLVHIAIRQKMTRFAGRRRRLDNWHTFDDRSTYKANNNLQRRLELGRGWSLSCNYVSALCGGKVRFAIRVIWQLCITVSERVLELISCIYIVSKCIIKNIYVCHHWNDAAYVCRPPDFTRQLNRDEVGIFLAT